MANPYYSKPASVVPGTTIRADKYNSDLDVNESAFNALHQRLEQAVFLPSTFSGNPTIPEQTVENTFIYIDGSGDIALYPIQTFLDQFAQVTAQYNQINSWREQVANNALSAQGSASEARNFANADKNLNLGDGYFSSKHYSLVAKDWADSAVQSFNNAQDTAAQAANSVQEADELANYAHNQLIPGMGKYSAYHWALEAKSYADQAQAIVGGNFVPQTRTINGILLDDNIILTPADLNAVPNSIQINGKPLTADITLTANDTGALPDTTTLATLGGVPLARTVNGKPLSSDISLDFNDVGALPSTTTINALGGVPVARQVNNKPLSADIVLTASDVGALPNSHLASKIGTANGSFTATRLAEITRYIYTGQVDATVTIDSSAFSAGDTLYINKSRQLGLLTITSGAIMTAPNGTDETTHTIPSGYDCTIEILFGANGTSQVRVY